MKTKEEIALMWIVLIVAGLITTAIMPEILVFVVLGYCAWGLYTHYSKKNITMWIIGLLTMLGLAVMAVVYLLEDIKENRD